MFTLTQEIDLSGYNLLMPCTAVGNVAQLSVDLIIATLKMKRIGSGYHNACMPMMGPPAYEHDDTNTTALEVYADTTKKLVIFQIRSPLVSIYTDSYHKDLLDFMQTNKIRNVYILSSSHAYEQHDVNSPIYAYMQNEAHKSIHSHNVEAFGWQEHKGKVIFGGGNAIKLYQQCTEAKISTFLLFIYISEGDNSTEASQLVSEINRILPLFEKANSIKLTIPISWKFLFGNDVPELIF